jgi:hypothetical protein
MMSFFRGAFAHGGNKNGPDFLLCDIRSCLRTVTHVANRCHTVRRFIPTLNLSIASVARLNSDGGNIMKISTKAFLAGAFALAAAQGASAQVRVGVYAGNAQPYYPSAVHVQPRYVSSSAYYGEREVHAVPDWRARQEWRGMREREYRRAQWQRQEEWRRHEEWQRHEEWRREHWREHGAQPYDRY